VVVSNFADMIELVGL